MRINHCPWTQTLYNANNLIYSEVVHTVWPYICIKIALFENKDNAKNNPMNYFE